MAIISPAWAAYEAAENLLNARFANETNREA